MVEIIQTLWNVRVSLSKFCGLVGRAGYRYPVFIENRLLTFDRYTEPNVCVSNKISIHSLRRVKQVCVELNAYFPS